MAKLVRAAGVQFEHIQDTPELRIEIAFDSGFATPAGDRTWTDVSEWAEDSAEITYGRSDELAVPDPNQASFTLDNSDGRFTPGLATSPYYPNVKNNKPVRLSVRYGDDGDWSVRFTGYIDAWPLKWPDGSSAAATITVSASSRRARLGKTAALTMSPIRYAYFQPTQPQAYWPMNGTQFTRFGQEVFLDETTVNDPDEVDQNQLAVFGDTPALFPTFLSNPRPGPIDENKENEDGKPIGLLMFPNYTNSALIGTRPHCVGSASACRVNTAGELTIECVARVDVTVDEGVVALNQLIRLQSADVDQFIVVDVAAFGEPQYTNVSCGMYLFEDGVLQHYEDDAGTVFQPDAFAIANDGEIHHYAFTLTAGGTVGTLYLDGVVTSAVTFPTPFAFEDDFTQIVLGGETNDAIAWIGHCAVRNEALTADQIAAHAAGATTQDESIEERMERIFGYMGVPADEITAEESVALGVSDQSQVDRAPVDVIDELAESTAGILYDQRDGILTMQARNHRYNQTPAFALNATTQEVEGDLEAVLDDRYLVNYIEAKRAAVDELTWFMQDSESIAAYGTYHGGTLEMVTTSWEEAQSAAVATVSRYAHPKVRISTVAVDVVNLDADQRAAVLEADIGTLFEVVDLPEQAPDSTMPLYLEGYAETITAASHTLSMNTTPGDRDTNVAVLDDPAFNVLDSGITLAY